ncbi:hypothetical protein Niako_0687 [Niastella koreensis GR20-10]|uniref:DUF3108 domain-containing protein n=2 Tax=Niastella koreensis TaxID=354356 RepID=G8TAC3_NIAKG|nr:hypothetical protein [Niastella koreensis]AEV97070.1 hypothetical protein Niako_0687 [Niastella koreensis GR20-10]
MRHLLLIAVLWTACNNTASTNKPGKQLTAAITEDKPDAGPAACNKLIFFEPGAEIITKSYDGAGKEISCQFTKIVSVKNEGGMTVAYAEASDTTRANNHVSNMKYSYKCDGKTIYFDMASMLRAHAQDPNATIEASMVEYPIAVSAGQTLPDATGTMSFERKGKKTNMKYRYKERKVDGKEKVTTPAGSWDCYKISNQVDVEVDFPGMSDKAKQMMQTMTNQMKSTGITWFSPDFGIVKFELFQNAKLVSRTEIISVKR